MANNVLDWVWQHSRSKHGSRLVLLALADRARENGTAWPSVPELKRMTGLGERAVQAAIIGLAALGELEVEYSAGSGNRYRVNTSLRYPVLPPAKSAKHGEIDPELRFFVFRRDGARCTECGSTEDLTLDHIYPKSLGGSDTAANLRVLCRPCNSRKGARV